MSVNIEMPKLSDTMTEGTLVKWHKKVGDAVEIGDLLAEIETDKATMEMEAFDHGTLTSILVQEGDKAPIGGILAVLDGASSPAPAQVAAPVTPAAVAPAPAPVPVSTPAPAPVAAPAPVVVPAVMPVVRPVGDPNQRVLASPLARKVAADIGVNLGTVVGTGPAGRITKADVEAASQGPAKTVQPTSSEAVAAAALVASLKTKPPVSSPAPAPQSPAPQAILPVAKAGDTILELNTLRKIIASRLVTSKSTIPHFYLHLEVDAAPLVSLRRQINEQAEHTHGNKYSVNDFILKAVVQAALAVPAVNSSFAGDHMVRFQHIGLCIAIAVEDGLVTPVIKEAETKSLLAISQAVKDFSIRAKARKLKPDEFDGGTITVSNLGAWGIESFDAIINPPQAAILSVGAAIEKPVVKNGQVVPGLRMNLGLSCDHRVIDGALGAMFLKQIKDLLEKPSLMLL